VNLEVEGENICIFHGNIIFLLFLYFLNVFLLLLNFRNCLFIRLLLLLLLLLL